MSAPYDLLVACTTSRPVPPLGIGLPYFSSLDPAIYAGGLLDFVEITPEMLARKRQLQDRFVIELVPENVQRAQRACDALPITVHGVELSIGSAHGWNTAYLDMLDEFHHCWPFLWHSEHLGFQTIAADNGDALDVGVPLPLPPTSEAVELVSARCVSVAARYGVPFALENPAHYLPGLPADPEVGDDVGLIRAIVERSGCFHLLDLHNVYCNAINLGCDPFDVINRMALDRVLEIHIAGGSWSDGFWMDAHDGKVPEEVWQLLEYTLPLTPNVAGVVFEMLEEHALRFGVASIAHELERARDIWQCCRCEQQP